MVHVKCDYIKRLITLTRDNINITFHNTISQTKKSLLLNFYNYFSRAFNTPQHIDIFFIIILKGIIFSLDPFLRKPFYNLFFFLSVQLFSNFSFLSSLIPPFLYQPSLSIKLSTVFFSFRPFFNPAFSMSSFLMSIISFSTFLYQISES